MTAYFWSGQSFSINRTNSFSKGSFRTNVINEEQENDEAIYRIILLSETLDIYLDLDDMKLGELNCLYVLDD